MVGHELVDSIFRALVGVVCDLLAIVVASLQAGSGVERHGGTGQSEGAALGGCGGGEFLDRPAGEGDGLPVGGGQVGEQVPVAAARGRGPGRPGTRGGTVKTFSRGNTGRNTRRETDRLMPRWSRDVPENWPNLGYLACIPYLGMLDQLALA